VKQRKKYMVCFQFGGCVKDRCHEWFDSVGNGSIGCVAGDDRAPPARCRDEHVGVGGVRALARCRCDRYDIRLVKAHQAEDYVSSLLPTVTSRSRLKNSERS
jgi:hypothetical protein